ncbi:winged helix-turn-helix transcriptional regulator [Kitasatospora sp. NPDC058170]|uniref:winged helix-turn-helix transcriptional regulator n=1 Tax=Kitasatospora sp. NPDC058170 TaxID=3346364 RepID=UPI0036DB2889
MPGGGAGAGAGAGGAFLADCRARVAFDLLGNTWSSVVLWALREEPARPGGLRVRIGGISAKVLTETLRRLEFNGLVERRSYPQVPPRVEYALTPLGRTLLPALEALGDWGYQHGDAVLEAQDRAQDRAQGQG